MERERKNQRSGQRNRPEDRLDSCQAPSLPLCPLFTVPHVGSPPEAPAAGLGAASGQAGVLAGGEGA